MAESLCSYVRLYPRSNWRFHGSHQQQLGGCSRPLTPHRQQPHPTVGVGCWKSASQLLTALSFPLISLLTRVFPVTPALVVAMRALRN